MSLKCGMLVRFVSFHEVFHEVHKYSRLFQFHSIVQRNPDSTNWSVDTCNTHVVSLN